MQKLQTSLTDLHSSIFSVIPDFFLPANLLVADRLERSAATMQKQIDQKLSPAISQQRPTYRRQRIADEMRSEGLQLQRSQACLNFLVSLHRSGKCPAFLYQIRTRKQIETLMSIAGWAPQYLAQAFSCPNQSTANVLISAGLTSTELTQAAIAALNNATPLREHEQDLAAAIRQQRMDAIFDKTPDFFPTPPDIINRMLQLGQVQPEHRILEPSAGNGDIALVLREICTSGIDCFELYYNLHESLELQKFNVLGRNFLEAKPEPIYDRVIMNPPFAGGIYVDHIYHAYEWLVDGGRLVSIAPPSYTFSTKKKMVQFREWLAELDAHEEQNPRDAFNQGDRPCAISTNIIVINKPE